MAQIITGKLLTGVILATAVCAGAGMYYFQVYAYYEAVAPTGIDEVQLTPLGSDTPQTIVYEDFQAIDAESSPIRFRACFTTPTDLATLSDTYEPYADPTPLVAPGWFDCFDAEAIGQELEDGRAVAFTGQRNFEYGVDSIVAVTKDGRGYIWHQVNDCGDKAYDGSPLDPTCPPRPVDIQGGN